MSDLDKTDLRVTAQLLREGLYQSPPPYPDAVLKAAIADVARRLTYAPLPRPVR